MKFLIPNLISFLVLFGSWDAWAQLQVYPTQVRLSGEQTSTSLTLKNTSNNEETYKISTVFYRMTGTGEYLLQNSVKNSDPHLMDQIKFSPKSIHLKPQETQVVRVMLINDALKTDGEYYSHLFFEPQTSPEKSKDQAGINMNLQAKLAVAIPVVYRKGQLNKKISLSKFSWKEKDGTYHFEAQIKNEGPGFLFGDIEIKNPESSEVVYRSVGVSSYLPLRTWKAAVPKDQLVAPIKGDSLQLSYKSQANDGAPFEGQISASKSTVSK